MGTNPAGLVDMQVMQVASTLVKSSQAVSGSPDVVAVGGVDGAYTSTSGTEEIN